MTRPGRRPAGPTIRADSTATGHHIVVPTSEGGPRTMTRPLTRRARRPVVAALPAALALLASAAPAPASTPARIADASYLADGPGDLALAVVVRDGRLTAYACDGISRRAYFTARARRGRQLLRNNDGARLTVRLGARTARATLALAGTAPLALTARRTSGVAILTVTIRPDGVVVGTAAGGGALGAHLSHSGLFGALARPGRAPRTLLAPGFAAAPLHLDGTPPPTRPTAPPPPSTANGAGLSPARGCAAPPPASSIR
jgi:hypothetical protein